MTQPDLPPPGHPCGHRWDSHICAELVQDPPAAHVHRCCCGATECTASDEWVTAVAGAIDEDGTAYLDDDTEVAAGNWTEETR